MKLGFPIIDLHTHLRSNIPLHTKIAKENGIDAVIYMANCAPPLDNLGTIKKSLKEKRYCKAIPVSAITKSLEGKVLVEIDEIKPYVVGFSDDGNYLKDLGLLKEVLLRKVLILAHCSPPYEIGVKNPSLETKFIDRYLNFLYQVGKKIKGWLHIQHVSRQSSVKLIREAKRKKISLSCETCPHYFTYSREDLNTRVNPPLGKKEDIIAIKEGLSDGTIDVIASDYAPIPRKSGVADFHSFLPLSYGLISEGILTKNQLKEKLLLNPKKIIAQGSYKNLILPEP